MTKISKYLEQDPTITKAVVSYAVKGDKVLLGVRNSSSTNLGVNKVAGLGGKLDPNETSDKALVRELKEEVGIIPTKFRNVGRVIFLNPHETKWNLDVDVYIIDEWDGEPTELEKITPEWFLISELPLDRMFSDNKYWLPRVLEGKHVNATFLFDENGIVESEIQFSEG